MSVTLTLDAKAIEDPQEAFLRTVNTRIAGGGRMAATAVPPRVCVRLRDVVITELSNTFSGNCRYTRVS